LTQFSIANVGVVDVAGGRVVPDQTVAVRDGRVSAVGQPAVPAGEVIDGRGKFLIPGLWDMHVHLCWKGESSLRSLVEHGITAVRDLGGHLHQLDAWRAEIRAGARLGPRIWRAGPILNGISANEYQRVIADADEARAAARELAEAGVDFLKTHRRTSRDAYFALLDEADKLGLAVVGHIPMEITPDEAVASGQVTVEHTETLFEGTFDAGRTDPWPAAVRRFRAQGADELFERVVENGVMVTPTLVPWALVLDGPPSEERAEWEELFPEFLAVVGQMHEAGVTLLAGTDIAADRPVGSTLHRELELLVEAGLTPLEALRTATITPPVLLHRDDLGTIEPGKLADLVLLEADPLEDISNTRRIAAVVARGRLVSFRHPR
jgi:imidazolonepropionase-like amidohydrolase